MSAYDMWLANDPRMAEFVCPHCAEPVDEHSLNWKKRRDGAWFARHSCGRYLYRYEEVEPGPVLDEGDVLGRPAPWTVQP